MNSRLKTNARSLRRNLTSAETALWNLLRSRRLGGFKFRRQVPIENYIADFCCYAVKLIVELDGDSHCERMAYDRQRDEELKKWGFFVLRYENCVVLKEENRVIEETVFLCRKRENDATFCPIDRIPIPLTPNPSPVEGEGDKT